MVHQDAAHILLVEDNPGDVVLVRQAMERAELPSILHVVVDGEQALAFLRREGEYAGAPRPHLVLLDLRLPRKNGHDVLDELKQDPELRQVPVVVMSTSQEPEDIVEAYGRHANSYIVKPLDVDKLLKMVTTLDTYWRSVVSLPKS